MRHVDVCHVFTKGIMSQTLKLNIGSLLPTGDILRLQDDEDDEDEESVAKTKPWLWCFARLPQSQL